VTNIVILGKMIAAPWVSLRAGAKPEVSLERSGWHKTAISSIGSNKRTLVIAIVTERNGKVKKKSQIVVVLN
jgi:hypothetical protein